MLGEIAWAAVVFGVGFWCGSTYQKPGVMVTAIKAKFRKWFGDTPAG